MGKLLTFQCVELLRSIFYDTLLGMRIKLAQFLSMGVGHGTFFKSRFKRNSLIIQVDLPKPIHNLWLGQRLALLRSHRSLVINLRVGWDSSDLHIRSIARLILILNKIILRILILLNLNLLLDAVTIIVA